MLKKIYAIIPIILFLTVAVFAQETEPAASSNLTGTRLPANALRALPGSVPAEVDQTLDKIVSAGNGKLVRGATEVVVWAGGSYKKSNAAQLSSQLQTAWKSDGWIFEIGGEQDGMAIFTLLKDGAERRAIIGFYGADENAFVLALSELHQAAGEKTNPKTDEPRTVEPDPEQPQTRPSVNSNASLRDLVGKWERKQGGMSSVDTTTGRYLGSSGNYESYEISADGRVAYTSLIAVQNYGCRLEAFSQSKGRASVSGATLSIGLNPGTIRRDDSCSQSKNYTKPTSATNTDFKFTLGNDDYGVPQLCLTQPDGETFCYRRAK